MTIANNLIFPQLKLKTIKQITIKDYAKNPALIALKTMTNRMYLVNVKTISGTVLFQEKLSVVK